jgi:hypothetical protein
MIDDALLCIGLTNAYPVTFYHMPLSLYSVTFHKHTMMLGSIEQ